MPIYVSKQVKHTPVGQCGVLSANVVNHPELSSVHQTMGAYEAGYYAPQWTRDSSPQGKHHYSYEYDPLGACSISSHDCARNTHLNFLHNVRNSPDLHMCVLAHAMPSWPVDQNLFFSGIEDFRTMWIGLSKVRSTLGRVSLVRLTSTTSGISMQENQTTCDFR